MNLEKLYEIESNSRLFEFKFKEYDLPMWIFVRYLIMDYLYYAIIDMPPVNSASKEYVSQKARFRHLIKSSLNTPFCHKQKDILFLFSTATEIPDGDKAFKNRICGDFFLAAKNKSALVQHTINYEYKMPNVDDDARCGDIIKLLIDRDKRDVTKAELDEINRFIEFLKNNVSIPLDESIYVRSRNALIFYAERIRPTIKYYKKLYKSIRPKAVVIEIPHVLANSVHLKVYAAKEMGIKVIELQHGLLDKALFPYNFGHEAFKNKQLKKCLPDYFLLYGDFWVKRINTPAHCVPIGNPHFSKNDRADAQQVKKSILVLDSEIESDLKINIFTHAVELAKKMPDYTINYRFHPLQKSKNEKAAKEFEKSSDVKNFKIDTEPNVYTSIHKNECVIGFNSTVFYEALCFKKKVYVQNTEIGHNSFDEKFFDFFDTSEELIEKIKNGEGKIISDKEKELIYKSNSQENYIRFLSEIGIY